MSSASDRLWRIGSTVHARDGWRLLGVGFQRSWRVRVDPLRMQRGAHDRLRASEWFDRLRTLLGRAYTVEDAPRRDLALARTLRRMSDPPTILDELRRLAAAVEGESIVVARHGRAKLGADPRRDLWTIARAVRRTAWRVVSITHGQNKGRVDRTAASIVLTAMIDSHDGAPGFAGMRQGWSRRRRVGRSDPFEEACRLLRRRGHRVISDRDVVHVDRFHRGLALRTALGEVELLERALDLVELRPRGEAGKRVRARALQRRRA